MADIILNKPVAGTQAVFEAARDSRIDLNFPTDQATLERSGNDLIFRFDDGSTVVLRDFYTDIILPPLTAGGAEDCLSDLVHVKRNNACVTFPDRTNHSSSHSL